MATQKASPDSPEGLAGLVPVPEAVPATLAGAGERGRWQCEQLERGNILFFQHSPFELPEEDRTFLLRQRQSGASYHKNVAYRPEQDRLTGATKLYPEDEKRLRAILKRYSDRAAVFLGETLGPYAGRIQRDYASFRPVEEQGRQLRQRARNDLLHTDAFPTRPTNGNRILRFFTNLNPSNPRVWITSETFDRLAEQYAREAGLDRIIASDRGARLLARGLARALGIGAAARAPYDSFMLRFHHFLKENQLYQDTCPKRRWEFPPGSSWMVYTDMVSHAVLSGQFAIEQTFIVAREALVLPARAPASILEKLASRPVTFG
jgi:3-deoxy-D-manno-oct-2-ulosonic acid (Kdo) hydroxylase